MGLIARSREWETRGQASSLNPREGATTQSLRSGLSIALFNQGKVPSTAQHRRADCRGMVVVTFDKDLVGTKDS